MLSLLKEWEAIHAATPADFAGAEISPSGLGVHLPKLDTDIYIPALLEDFLGSRRWIALQMGKAGGKASPEAKTTAARENRKLGGRPGKTKAAAS